MKVKLITFCCLLLPVISVFAQNQDNDYKVISINRKVADISYENPYQSPEANYVARMHLWMNGKYDTIYSETIDAIVRRSERKPYLQKVSENMLNSEIEQVVIYKDSIGLVFRQERGSSSYIVGSSQWENGKWLGTGEDICSAKNVNDRERWIKNMSIKKMKRLQQYYKEKIVSTDTLAFVHYLQQKGEDPKKYILQKIADFPLVVYGEIHRRELSWNLLKDIVNTPNFTDVCSTVFMELPYYNLQAFDKLLNNNKLDTTLIFQILETEQQYGWQDKGEYEFIKEIWKINQTSKNKTRIIPVDFQANWDEMKTKEDFQNYRKYRSDRDSTMAKIIDENLNINDQRHCLFIVGMWHAKKSSPTWQISAGTLLDKKLPKNTIFSIISHTMISDNADWHGQLRYGLFDCAFEKNENKPVAFDLKSSPFGKEPFDAFQEVRFSPDCGNYEDFYDGYIFLSALKEEPYEYELSELYTDKFVEELKRRALISGDEEGYYGIPVEELTKGKIVDSIKVDKERSGNRRYSKYFNGR